MFSAEMFRLSITFHFILEVREMMTKNTISTKEMSVTKLTNSVACHI